MIEVANQLRPDHPGADREDDDTAPAAERRTGSRGGGLGRADRGRGGGWIANLVLDLADEGVRFRDIAVLVRSRAAYPRLVEQFATFGIPVQPGGRSGLFDQPEAVSSDTRSPGWVISNGGTATARAGLITEEGLLDEYQRLFGLNGARP